MNVIKDVWTIMINFKYIIISVIFRGVSIWLDNKLF